MNTKLLFVFCFVLGLLSGPNAFAQVRKLIITPSEQALLTSRKVTDSQKAALMSDISRRFVAYQQNQGSAVRSEPSEEEQKAEMIRQEKIRRYELCLSLIKRGLVEACRPEYVYTDGTLTAEDVYLYSDGKFYTDPEFMPVVRKPASGLDSN